MERSDLAPILASHTGNQIFEQTLARMSSPEEVLRVLSRYIYFNSFFGSGVASLAGEIGARQDIFRDPAEEVETISDRSIEVAAEIFYAAIDEFGNPLTLKQSTHRTLAQATLKATGQFYNYDTAALNCAAQPNNSTLAATERVRTGYGVGLNMDERKLLKAIGFHIGSEVLADAEFNILDAVLRAEYADLVEHLRKSKVFINGTENMAYRWIQIHTSVEADHFSAAMVGANLALRYYAGSGGRGWAKQWLIEGFREFAAMQTDFMEGLLE
jgi:hypothetical protein